MWTRRVLILLLCLGLSPAAQARDMTRTQIGTLQEMLSACVAAVQTGTVQSFQGWRISKGRIPEGFVYFQRMQSPKRSFRAYFGNRVDAPQGSQECAVVYIGGTTGPFATVKALDIASYFASLNTITLAGVRFVPDEMANARGTLIGCINGLQYRVSASTTEDGMVQPMVTVALAAPGGAQC